MFKYINKQMDFIDNMPTYENEEEIIMYDTDKEDSIWSDSDELSISSSYNDNYNFNSLDDEIIDMVDEIYATDHEHSFMEKKDKHYYLGIYENCSKDNLFIMTNSISANTYFKFSHEDCLQYLYWYGITMNVEPNLQLLQLHINDDQVYTVVLKTFWLKIIQRKWKNIYKKRMEVLNVRKRAQSLFHKETTGQWPMHANYFPGLKGMLVY